MKKNITYIFGLLLLTSLVFHSCKKENNSNISGLETEVFIRTAKLTDQESQPLGSINKNSTLASNNPSSKNTQPEVQEITLPFSDELSIVARLEPVKANSFRENILADSDPSGNEITQGLEAGTRYRVLVYNSSGDYVAHNDFTVGEETQEDSFKLNSGETYTFISYSVGSKTDLPELKDNQNEVSLDEASLHEISSGFLMYQKQNVQIVGGRDNYVDILMKHQFSQITTIIRHKYEAGRIDAVSNARFTPARENASLAFHNNSLSYSSSTKEAAVVFDEITGNTHEVISQPVSLISEATENAEFKIESLTINGLSNPLVYDELKITPGVRYNLILEIDARCIKDTDKRVLNLDVTSGTETFTLPAADYGFVFDIYELDNSFDMEINGVHLLSGNKQTQNCPLTGYPNWDNVSSWVPNSFIDVNFENNKGESIGQNIRFKEDKSKYGEILLGYKTVVENGKPVEKPVYNEIWNITGTTENPALRIIIEKNGTVRYYGSKIPEGPLLPLEIITSPIEYDIPDCSRSRKRKERAQYTENTITWHNDQSNIVKIHQAKIGATHMKATGYGQQKVSCNDM